MYTARQKVYWFAINSRISVFLLQVVFNAICSDHYADAFKTPSDPNEKYLLLDGTIEFLLGGLTRWDAQYYIHIAKYGYTYENTLAFFPLFPLSLKYITVVLNNIGSLILSYSNIIVIIGFVINFICFVKATLILYDLTEVVFKNTNVAYRAAILFCINPASIFFTALYTESMFAYLTFYSMLESTSNNPCVFISLGLSTLVRSNGLINIGFPIYTWLRNLFTNTIPNYISENQLYHSNKKSLLFNFRHIFISVSQIISVIILSLLPFCFLQIYNYTEFCKLNYNSSFPLHVKQYAQNNNLLLLGKQEFPWCLFKMPIAYSYVQRKYWNVGFLRYYQLRQIPNFCLAFPILYLMMKCSICFIKEHKSKFYTLEFFTGETVKDKNHQVYPIEMFVFVMHGLFLTLFSIFMVHIQVSTRLLCSASPILYWYCALETMPKLSNDSKEIEYENHRNILSKWKVFFFTQQQYLCIEKLIFGYFLGYTIVGCFMFSNFLPWT
ncbi:PREDICTED: GPI mannosyltransferase 2 [Ceratosolen solmsi marchali]|uniref:GPI mannosyltransferase 2 n=1 Tax=Ceratosolen solmsi marchali TaxID=326594 RepID=A0AAJ7DXU9_9HYME|nr:PREDICTED: GPI mannosyltransferase 2 [Ceratosolen solmsi marchali]XP_011500371.1 PREDICTED: GPI mannosyltransferase 2 [Ceratosolen solmsi marchali]